MRELDNMGIRRILPAHGMLTRLTILLMLASRELAPRQQELRTDASPGDSASCCHADVGADSSKKVDLLEGQSEPATVSAHCHR